jgi:Transcriptional regulator containing an amidase domain and an AraC-type DNA-binding HTH domain
MEICERTAPSKMAQLDVLYEQLIDIIGRRTVGVEDCSTLIGGLNLFRREAPTQPSACRVEPSIVFVVQGSKQLLIGDHDFTYDRSQFLIHSFDIPGNSQAIEASLDKPCLGLVLRLDLSIIAELVVQNAIPQPRVSRTKGSSALGAMTPTLLEPFCRLLSLLDEPRAIPVLAPLIVREIHFRMLMSDQAARLWQIASVGSMSNRISRAIEWLRENYNQLLHINELASHVQMSSSSLHQNFRALTSMSPLQYQK